jgi:hypothetical protein
MSQENEKQKITDIDVPTPHHQIAIGRNAIATKPYEFVLSVNVEKDPNQYIKLSTILTPEEHAVIYNVLERMVRSKFTINLH